MCLIWLAIALVVTCLEGCAQKDAVQEDSKREVARSSNSVVDGGSSGPATTSVIEWTDVSDIPPIPALPRDPNRPSSNPVDQEAPERPDTPVGAVEVLPLPDMDFGLECMSSPCRAVTTPAQQCCTRQQDVDSRRARGHAMCGVTLPGRTGCFELEQLGVYDTACPAQPSPADPEVMLFGCCTDGGQCGVFDTENGIGCRGDEGVDQVCGLAVEDAPEPETDQAADIAELADGGQAMPGAGAEEDACAMVGTYAARVRLDVIYRDRTPALMELDPSRGFVEILLRAKVLAQEEGKLRTDFEVCGFSVPPFRSTLLCEIYEPVSDPTAFDEAMVRRIAVEGAMSCARPGCQISFPATTATVGIRMDDPDGPWPAPGQAPTVTCAKGKGVADCFPDEDQDGLAGVSMGIATEGTVPDESGTCRALQRHGVPLATDLALLAQGGIRAEQLAIAVRARIAGSGVLDADCNVSDGLALADFVDSRAVDCLHQPGTRNLRGAAAEEDEHCTAAEVTYLDQNMPVYEVLQFGQRPADVDDRAPSRGPRFRFRRLSEVDDEVSCSDVRAALADRPEEAATGMGLPE